MSRLGERMMNHVDETILTKQHTISVFLAEDHPVVKKGISLVINGEADMEIVGESADGREVLPAVRSLLPDVVVLDADMPGLSGIEIAKQIREHVPDSAVLIFTGHDDDELLFGALDAGVAGFALKGVPIPDLLRAIRTVYAGEICISPRMTTKLVGEYLRRSKLESETDGFDKLSSRERQVLPMLASGKSHDDIGGTLEVSPYTVQTYRQRIMRKLDLHSSTDLLKFALRKGIVNLE